MIAHILLNDDYNLKIQISLTKEELNEYGENANAIADEVLKKVATSINVEDTINIDIEKAEIERHVATHQQDHIYSFTKLNLS